ncbi:hypothetical protein U0355_12955 [Salimicrobium sp. PL1-032A]|uniref:hypothetical protein n=1 Tax=Salimicrobium sp. PL1-032A TaxID=3095364 RepID=UPI003261D222
MLEQLDEKILYIRELRNMREHEIEYYKDEGYKQEKFVRVFGMNASDATSTIVTNGNYYVGGRISVQEVKSVFESFLPIAIMKYDEFMLNL